MYKKFYPSLEHQNITKENINFLVNNLPYKCEIIDGKIYLNNGEVKVEDALMALLYHVGLKQTMSMLPKHNLDEAFEYFKKNIASE